MKSSIKVNTDNDLGVFSFISNEDYTFDLRLIISAFENFDQFDSLNIEDQKIYKIIIDSLKRNNALPFGFTTQEKNYLIKEKILITGLITLSIDISLKFFQVNL